MTASYGKREEYLVKKYTIKHPTSSTTTGNRIQSDAEADASIGITCDDDFALEFDWDVAGFEFGVGIHSTRTGEGGAADDGTAAASASGCCGCCGCVSMEVIPNRCKTTSAPCSNRGAVFS